MPAALPQRLLRAIPLLFPSHRSCCPNTPSPSCSSSSSSDSESDYDDSEREASEQLALPPPKSPPESVYHTLEYDRLAMAEHQLLQQQDRDTCPPHFGATQLSLKHLLAAIDANRAALTVSDLELYTLLASEYRIGQEELYEAAEKVLLELRAYTQHSTPFLNKVSKRDAPDYFDVIKSPMDLGTVMKKLKNLQYTSKSEFVDDLLLIWSNCLQYNADPNHFMRKHALAMRKKTLELVQFIPDITTRDRADVEQEEEDNSEEDMPKHGKKSVQKKHPSRKSHVPQQPASPPPQPSPPPDLSSCPQIEKDDSARDDDADSSTESWQTQTRHARAILCRERHQLFKDDQLQSDMPALQRTPHLMQRFYQYEKRHAGQNVEDDDQNLNMDDLINEIESKEMKCDDSALVEYLVTSGIPELFSPSDEDLFYMDSGIVPSPSDPRLCPPPNGLINSIDANLRQLLLIRKICVKISAVKQMTLQSFVHPHHYKRYDSKDLLLQQDLNSIPVNYLVERPFLVSPQVAYVALQRVSAKVLYHTGFEDFESLALDAFTELIAEFFQKLATTIRLFSDIPGHSMEQVLLLSLHRNGIPDLDALESYVKDDIERYGSKLQDIHKKMASYLAALLRPSTEFGDENSIFNENSQSFVNGNLSETTGEDFFGFKELGLDKEFGISSFSVPLHLLQTRVQNGLTSNPTLVSKYKEPPSFPPLSLEVVESQVGLVKAFLLFKLESGILIDDDDLPAKQRAPRLRLPPSGKICTPRKRNFNYAFNSKKKKKLAENGEPPDSPSSSIVQ